MSQKRITHENIPDTIQKIISNSPDHERIVLAVQAINDAGGVPYLVGGAVRDSFLNSTSKDIDIEVHGIEFEKLQEILGRYGHVNTVGKSFGVLMWEHSGVEWVMPRSDLSGRKPEVSIDAHLPIEKALRRRDLTINAMALNMLTGQLIDPFGGQDDLKNKRGRSPDVNFFTQDPLRFYRVMQFIGRFNLTPDNALNNVCKSMDITSISRERIHAEFDKLFLKSKCPSLGLRWLYDINRVRDVLPELAACVGVLQQMTWHPEGDVFEHSMQALDAAARFDYEDSEERCMLLSAALCHDLGKPLVTRIESDRIRSIGHDLAGVPVARNLMNRITGNKKRIDRVCTLVRYHMEPGTFIANNAGDSAYKRLALKLAPDLNLYILSRLATADKQGRNPENNCPLESKPEAIVQFISRAEACGVLYEPVPALLTGADIIGFLEPGPQIGTVLKRAYELQINEGIVDKEQLLKRIVKDIKRD